MISVIIPLFNKEKSIDFTVQSVLRQGYANFELIVVDDGSTDRSVEILSEFDDQRLKVLSKENGGVSSARNFGADRALYDWLFFLDADDIVFEKCFSILVGLVNEYPDANIFTANFVAENKSGKKVTWCSGSEKGIVVHPFKSLWQRNIYPRTGNTLIRKEAFYDAGQFREECSVWEDLELFLNLLNKNIVAYSPEIVFKYNLELNELSQQIKPLDKEFAFYIDLQEASNPYHKLILLELLVRIRDIRTKLKDKKSVDIIARKLGHNSFKLFFGRAERYINKHLRLLF